MKKLPPAERAEAEATHKFFQELRDLPREEREAKFMNDPAVQERLEKGMSSRDARRSPQQRMERSRKYVENKQAIKSGQTPASGGNGGGRGPR